MGNFVYELLKRYNTFSYYTEEELDYAKTICENNHKLNLLAERYEKNNSTHTLGTIIEKYYEIVGESFQEEINKRSPMRAWKGN